MPTVIKEDVLASIRDTTPLMYHRLQHSGIVDALGMAADAEPQRRWINPPEAVVDQKHILVNLDCDNIIGARLI